MSKVAEVQKITHENYQFYSICIGEQKTFTHNYDRVTKCYL